MKCPNCGDNNCQMISWIIIGAIVFLAFFGGYMFMDLIFNTHVIQGTP